MAMDAWRYNVEAGNYRDPPCNNCGVVDPWVSARPPGFRHCCNPTHVQMRQLGQQVVEQIAEGIRDAFNVFALTPSTG